MPHFKHDCMNPRCCTYVGSGDVLGADDKPKYFDVYVYTSLKNSTHAHISLNIREGDDGWDYLTTPLDNAMAYAARGDSPLYAAALKVYNDYLKG